jgi:hypothetical protein
LFAVAGERKHHMQIRPTTLNYLGMLGPEGKDFGSFVHIMKDVNIDGSEKVELSFML